MKKSAGIVASIILSLFLTVGLCHASANNQTAVIEGMVAGTDGEALPGVHISVTDLNVGTFSGSNGRFRIAGLPAGQHTLHLSMVGFLSISERITLQPGETKTFEFVLTPIILESGELVVTASRRSQLIGKVSVSMNTISPEEIRSRNIISLDQALDNVPGVQVLGNTVNIRGSSGFTYGVGSRVLLLVDGVPMMGPDQGGFDFDGLPLMQTQQVEILKSPGSALYGGGALGGVVNIITKQFPETSETTLRYYTGFYQPVRFDEWQAQWDKGEDYRPKRGLLFGRSHKVNERFGYWFSGSLNEDAGYLNENRFRAAELYTKLGWSFSRDIDLTLYSSARRKYREEFLYWNGLDDVLNPGSISINGETASGGNDGVSDRLTILPVFRHLISESVQYQLKGRLFGVAFRPLDSAGNMRPRVRHNTGVRYGGEAQVDVSPVDRLIFTGGVTFDENYIRSDLFVGEDSLMVRNQPEGAVFMQAEMDWNEKLTTTAGFRYDAYRVHTLETATQFSPKFSASYAISNYITTRASFGKGFRVPSVAERFVSSSDFFPLESNLALQPETSTGYEAGFTVTSPIGRNFYLKADVSGFWNEYQRLVEPTFISELSAFQFINLTEARIRGFETSLTFSSNDQRLNLSTGYTHLDAIDLELNQALLYRSKHLLQVSGRSFITGWFDIGFDFRAASAPERVDSDFSIFVPDAEVFPASYVTDIRTRLTWQEPVGGLDLSGSFIIKNLFDYYYVERPAIFAPPRSFEVVLDVTF
ncbi:N/A [soil metagenome]